jgi:hypothetical protein
MMSTMSKDALARLIECGEYAVDPHAVADAMLRRGGLRSVVLVAEQPFDGAPVRVEQDEPAPGADIA